MSETKKDLLVLVADLDAEETIKTLLAQSQKLGIRAISYQTLRHPQHDSGCYSDAHNLLRSQYHLYHKVLVIFDYHGSGQDDKQSVEEIQNELEERLCDNGWTKESVRVIILNPELEIWVWSDSSQVDEVLGWKGHQPALRNWLENAGLWQADSLKPADPKEAMRQALREVQKRPNATLFKQLAEKISFKRCTDASFLRFRDTLLEWFAAE